MSAMDEYTPGSLVWAKMKRFPPWPGMLTANPETLKKPKTNNKKLHCVFFFGSENYGWVEDYCIRPYVEFKQQLETASKLTNFKNGCRRAIDYQRRLDRGEVIISDDNTAPLDFDFSSAGSSSAAEEEDPLPESPKKVTKVIPKRKKTPANDEEVATTSKGLRGPPAKKRKQAVKPNKNMVVAVSSSTIVTADAPAKVDLNEVPDLKIGFIGTANMGDEMIKCLIKLGHDVSIWNPNIEKSAPFLDEGAIQMETLTDIVNECSIIFLCAANSDEAYDMILGPAGDEKIVQGIDDTKSLVVMTSTNYDVFTRMYDGVKSKGGRFMEALLHGRPGDAEKKELIVLVSGDESLYYECKPIFDVVAKEVTYLETAGAASKYNVIAQTIMAASIVALAEGMALADRVDLDQNILVKVLEQSAVSSLLMTEKGSRIAKKDYDNPDDNSVQDVQQKMTIALAISDEFNHTMPVTAVANESFKRCRHLGFSNKDPSTVYMCTRF